MIIQLAHVQLLQTICNFPFLSSVSSSGKGAQCIPSPNGGWDEGIRMHKNDLKKTKFNNAVSATSNLLKIMLCTGPDYMYCQMIHSKRFVYNWQ